MPKGKYKRSKRPAIFPVGPSIAYIMLSQGQLACVDWDDAIWLQGHNWHASLDESTGSYYADRTVHDPIDRNRAHKVRMHQEIMGITDDGRTPDHIIPGNSIDNRRANLRFARTDQQVANRRTSKNNTSGVKGVGKYGNYGKWRVRIGQLHAGVFSSFEEAMAHRSKLATEAFGEFARH